jgi:rfaE bifunctional protein kinase chain/domain
MTEHLSRQRLLDLLLNIRELRIGVLGDFALDGYWYVDMTQAELSREAPLFNHPVVRETYSAGGGANACANVAALKPAQVWALTVLGEDWRGELLRQVLAEQGVRLGAIVTQPGWISPFYGKVVLQGWGTQQEDARVDFVNIQAMLDETADALIQRVEQLLPELDAVVVTDYFPVGVVTDRVVAALNRMAREHQRVIFTADSRDDIGQFESMVIKPNEVEAAAMYFPGRPPETITPEEFSRAGMRAQKKTGRPLYITRSDKGCLLCHPPQPQSIPAVPVPPPIDTVGAGDTFIAALAAALAADATPWEAGWVATLAAGVTVGKLRITGTASPEEILDLYDRFYTDEESDDRDN